jgi:dTDP-4-dehydrorhamnose 3,5-epimerase-like enzyme
MVIKSLKQIEFQRFIEDNGQLSIFQVGSNIPFDIKRVFTVLSDSGHVRGSHAHIFCSQILFCLAGEVRLTCDDGIGNKDTITLNRKSNGILIPPMIWAKQEYLVDNSLLMVICNQEFNEQEYIRDYDIFKDFIKDKL